MSKTSKLNIITLNHCHNGYFQEISKIVYNILRKIQKPSHLGLLASYFFNSLLIVSNHEYTCEYYERFLFIKYTYVYFHEYTCEYFKWVSWVTHDVYTLLVTCPPPTHGYEFSPTTHLRAKIYGVAHPFKYE
jgi:hypothetical protein